MNSSKVEIQINETATPDDDYITWAPTKCRIRLSPLFRSSEDLKVVLTNREPNIPTNSGQPRNGRVSFAAHVDKGETARDSNIGLTLPADGEWVSFIIAGCFPEGASRGYSSSRDKDTVIEVHEGSEGGPVIGTHQLMVRVRKDITTLTEHEKYRLLDAIGTMHKEGRYEKFVEVHDWGSRGDRRHDTRINHPEYSYADTAHRDSNFLAWHRIDLLQFERELQKTHPDVSVHYWKLDEGDPKGIVFSPDMYGANEVDMDNPPVLNRTPYLDFVRFSLDNPLHGWRVEYQGRFANPERLTRWPVDRRKRPWTLGRSDVLPGESDLLKESNFRYFSDALEVETHNKSHHWMGPPMRDCTVAPADPFFWSFHAWFDRVWARWQRKYDRFATDGSNNSYEPLGEFAPSIGSHPRGHFLEDTMWPWDGVVGEATHQDPEVKYRLSRPPMAPMGLFPESKIPGLWPSISTKPRVKDAIDYLGMGEGIQPLGYCYDDTPYGKMPSSDLAIEKEKDLKSANDCLKRAKSLRDPSLSDDQRLHESSKITYGNLLPEEELHNLLTFMKEETNGALKSEALRLLSSSIITRKDALAYALNELESGSSSDQFKLETLNMLNFLSHFAPREMVDSIDLHSSLISAANSKGSLEVSESAVQTLAMQGDSFSINRLRSIYKDISSSSKNAEVARILSIEAGGLRDHGSILTSEFDAQDPESLLTVLMAGGHVNNPDLVKSLVISPEQPERIRIAAVHILSGLPDYMDLVINWLVESSIPTEIKMEAIALIRPESMSVSSIALFKSLAPHLSPQLRARVLTLTQETN
ncbi:tyrosinase family protein [Mangrovimonas sp. TPBH4]|uniref:tyrosinase family protein n=1 Tax=Mangrovimonas sp. TPBH4 TaxID=1645914 RepID=UPI000B06F1F8|nr:tyrosinase family protein [Mangrovimonas sp. TPBH4]